MICNREKISGRDLIFLVTIEQLGTHRSHRDPLKPLGFQGSVILRGLSCVLINLFATILSVGEFSNL